MLAAESIGIRLLFVFPEILGLQAYIHEFDAKL
jgi:hypothetical protein